MGDQCEASPSGELLKAFGEFNREAWFECHETLENLWIGSQGEIRDFYQGVLQIAVALHHWRNGNLKGALSLLESGSAYLRNVSTICQRIDVAGLRESALRLHSALAERGAVKMAELPAELIPKLKLV